MLKWEIEGEIRWLCKKCTRENTPVFLLAEARLLAEEKKALVSCFCCRRTDEAADMFRGWRWFYSCLCSLLGGPSPARSKALRRAKE